MQPPTSLNGPHHALFLRSGPLLVLFSGTNKADGQFDFWGYAQRSSASCLLLNNGENRWYQSGVPGFGASVDETANLIRSWALHTRATEIICIGASMGGSAAVLYGSLIGARILAFSFEANIRHQGSRSIKYIPSDYNLSYPDLKPLIEKSSKPIISLFGGDDVIDVAEASRLNGLPNLRLICLQGVDHGVPRHLRLEGKLDKYLDSFIKSETLHHLRNIDDDLDIDGYANSVEKSHIALTNKDAELALLSARKAISLKPTALVPHLLAGKSLLLLKRPLESLEHLGIAVSFDKTTAESRLCMGRALRALRRYSHASDFHQHTVELFPKEHRVHYDLALALWSMGDKESARSSVATALKLAPRNSSYANRLEMWRTG